MTTAANPDQYQNPAWSQSPWAGPGQTAPNGATPYGYGPSFWHPYGPSRALGIAATVLGFMVWWPVGLALLIFMGASGRIGCRGRRMWMQQNQAGNGWQASPPWSGWGGWGNWCGGGNNGGRGKQPSSGNHAFDEYRTETLRRLEDEQKDFTAFLDRLRFAKDKAEFDQFMADRRQAPRPPSVPDEPSHG